MKTKIPPEIKHVIRAKVPEWTPTATSSAGSVVLRDAPLGTYLGWNITAAGFHAGKICNCAGA